MAWLRRRKKQNARPAETSIATGMLTPRPIFRALESSETVDGAEEEGDVAESVFEVSSEASVVVDDRSEDAVPDTVVESDVGLGELCVLLVVLVVVTASAAEDVLSTKPDGVRVYLETPFVGG